MTKIRIRVGGVEVEYEGPEAFLDKKLPELIDRLSALSARSEEPEERDGESSSKRKAQSGDPGTLASFLKGKDIGTFQLKRFLATAEWLHQRGSKMLHTGDVTGALRDNHQSKLTNPADCLNKNVTKGHCEKHGKQFYVTDEGRNNLG